MTRAKATIVRGNLLKGLALLGGLLVATSTATAAPWSGSNGVLEWSAGQSDYDRITGGTFTGTDLTLDVTGFDINITNGVSSVSDRLSFQVKTVTQADIIKVTIEQIGNWSITGDGEAYLQITGGMAVTQLNTPEVNRTFTDAMDVVYQKAVVVGPDTIYEDLPGAPTSAGEGRWIGTYELTLPSNVWNIQVVLNSVLQGYAGPGVSMTAGIESFGAPTDGTSITIVPEPTTASAIALAAAGWMLRRRASRRDGIV